MKKLGILIVFAIALLLGGCDVPPDTVFSVIYHGNGNTHGFPPADNNEYTSGMEAAVLDKGTLEKTGHTFLHWNTRSDGTGNAYNHGDRIVISNSTIFLYAIWTAI